MLNLKILFVALFLPLISEANIVESLRCSSASGHFSLQVTQNKANSRVSFAKAKRINVQLESLDFEIEQNDKFIFSLVSIEAPTTLHESSSRCMNSKDREFSQKIQLYMRSGVQIGAPFYMICSSSSKDTSKVNGSCNEVD